MAGAAIAAARCVAGPLRRSRRPLEGEAGVGSAGAWSFPREWVNARLGFCVNAVRRFRPGRGCRSWLLCPELAGVWASLRSSQGLTEATSPAEAAQHQHRVLGSLCRVVSLKHQSRSWSGTLSPLS